MNPEAFLSAQGEVVQVRIARTDGSSPREVGADMFVSQTAFCGTIGGGQLEYMAMDQARQMLRDGTDHFDMKVHLGPEIGQCCGGRVELRLELLGADARRTVLKQAHARRADLPQVLIFGAGHVGRALARVLSTQPVAICVIDSRDSELALVEYGETRLCALPEAEISTAPERAAFVIATHDHALDFLLAAEALKRGDAAYVGMIGSKTKRARFSSWVQETECGCDVQRLVCPMGAAGLGDKRPEVIALHVASEVIQAMAVGKTVPNRMELVE